MRKIIAAILTAASVLALMTSCGGGTVTDAPGTTEVQSVPDITEDVTTPQIQTDGDVTTAAPVDVNTPEYRFRHDCFADGKLPDELLDSCSPGVLASLSNYLYYESVLQESVAKGQKWVYSNNHSYVPQNGTFADMVKGGKCGANCAMAQAWNLIDLGVFPNASKHLYGNGGGGIQNIETLGKYIGAVATIYAYNGTKTFSQLFRAGEVKAGDIFFVSGHTFVYLGDNKFMATGHDSKWHEDLSAQTEDTKHAVYDSFIADIKGNTDYDRQIYWLVRFKDNYIPKYCRNSEGNLLRCPIYNASESIEYVQGKSPETYEIEYRYERTPEIYDVSGRNNVLLGKTVSKTDAFNLAAVSYAANITDGKLMYDATAQSYTDFKMGFTSAEALEPPKWFNANGESSNTKDDTFRYLCGFRIELDRTYSVDGFSIYSQSASATASKRTGDVDGFDILVSEDGKNWTVVYSVTDAMHGEKYTDSGEESNKNENGIYMCHYIRADFDKEYKAKYVMYALTQPRTSTKAMPGYPDYTLVGSAYHFFRISELQVYEVASIDADS